MIGETQVMLNRNQRLQPKGLPVPQTGFRKGFTCPPDRVPPLVGAFVGSSLALALIIAFFFFPVSASAHIGRASPAAISEPVLQVNAGFNARYRDGNWVPVQISVSNNGADLSGMLSIAAPSPFGGPGNPTSTYKESITLANGAQKQVTMYVPLNFGAPGSTQAIKINLLDDNGNVVRSQSSTLTSVGLNDVFVAVLSDQNVGFNPLYSISLPNQGGSMVVETLNASTLPAGTHLLPIGSPNNANTRRGTTPGTLNAPITVSTATLAQGNNGDLQSATILSMHPCTD